MALFFVAASHAAAGPIVADSRSGGPLVRVVVGERGPGGTVDLAWLRQVLAQGAVDEARAAQEGTDAKLISPAPASLDPAGEALTGRGLDEGSLAITDRPLRGPMVEAPLAPPAAPLPDDLGAAWPAAGAKAVRGASLGRVLADLVNVVPTDEWTAAAGDGRRPGTAGHGAADAGADPAGVLDGLLVDAFLYLVRPQFATEGLITFSILGLGQFAIVAGAGTDNVALVDLGTMTSIRLSSDVRRGLGGPDRRSATVPGRDVRTGVVGFRQFLEILLRYAVRALTDPLTVAAAIILAFAWGVWRTRRRA